MKFIWNNKFIFWNFVVLIIIKAVFSYSGFQLAGLITGGQIFSKEEVIAQTNQFRSSLGFSKLKENPTLDAAASQKLQDMINNQYFAHFSPNGASPWYWIEKNRYDYAYAGENLAIGFLSAPDTVNAWANSASHRTNLLNQNYKEIGVAVAPAKIQNTKGILVVQLFGTPSPKPLVVIRPTPKPQPTTSPGVSKTPRPTAIIPASAATPPKPIFNAAEKAITFNTAAITPRINKISKKLNLTLIFYSLLIFMISVLLLIIKGATRELVLKTSVSFVFTLLAVAVPVFQLTRTALIF